MPPDELTPADQTYLDNRGQGVDAPTPPEPVPEPPALAPAEPAVPEPAPATPAAAAPSDSETGLKNALAAERDRRRKAEDTARTERLERERLAGRVDEIARRFAETAPPASAAEPDIDVDPVAALKAEKAARQRLELANAERVQRETDAQRQQNDFRDLQTRYAASAREFAQSNPDWAQAYQHYNTMRERVLIAGGIADPVERQNIMARDEFTLAQRAFADGASPAERLYAAAQALGHTKPAPTEIPPGQAGVLPVAPAAPAQPAQPGAPRMPTEAEKLAAIARGADASRSLGQSGGNAPAANMSLESMLKMSEADFAKVPHDVFERVMMKHYDGLPRQ